MMPSKPTRAMLAVGITSLGSPKKIFINVPGAPFKIGDKVKVKQLMDDEGDKQYLNKHGEVIYFEYTCGCGQSFPNDPMIGVKFNENDYAEFWKEELVIL